MFCCSRYQHSYTATQFLVSLKIPSRVILSTRSMAFSSNGTPSPSRSRPPKRRAYGQNVVSSSQGRRPIRRGNQKRKTTQRKQRAKNRYEILESSPSASKSKSSNDEYSPMRTGKSTSKNAVGRFQISEEGGLSSSEQDVAVHSSRSASREKTQSHIGDNAKKAITIDSESSSDASSEEPPQLRGKSPVIGKTIVDRAPNKKAQLEYENGMSEIRKQIVQWEIQMGAAVTVTSQLSLVNLSNTSLTRKITWLRKCIGWVCVAHRAP